MKNNLKILAAVIFVFVLILPALAFEFGTKNFSDTPPATRLSYPIRETLTLGAEKSVEFKWGLGDSIDTDSYDFRLYKGYDMSEENLISKQVLSADTHSLEVDASIFKDGQIYTWSVIRIALSGHKSDRSFSSFRVIKK